MNKLATFFVRNVVGYEKDRFQKLLDEEKKGRDNQLKIWLKYMNKYGKEQDKKVSKIDILNCIEDKPINEILRKPIEGGIKNITFPEIKIQEYEVDTLISNSEITKISEKTYRDDNINANVLKQSKEFIESLFNESVFIDMSTKPESEPTSQLNSPTINFKLKSIRSQKIKQLVELFEQGLDFSYCA